MDISKLDVIGASNNGVDIKILNPLDNEPMGLEITVVGSMSTNYQDDLSILFAEIEDYKEENKLPENPTKKQLAQNKILVDKFDAEITAKFLAKYTKGWKGLIENGKEISFSIDEAERIYKQYPIIRTQVQRGMMDIANFIKA